MAVPTVFKSYEVDNFPDKAVGILLPFNGNANLINVSYPENRRILKDVKPFKLSYSTEEQAISNLVNLLLTRKGERLMQPSFGSPIPDFVFEPNSEKERLKLKRGVQRDIEFWLPYIVINDLQVFSGEDSVFPNSVSEHNVIIRISFQVTATGANKEITLFIGDGIINYEIE